MHHEPSENPRLSKEEVMRYFLMGKMNVCPFGREAAEADNIVYANAEPGNLSKLEEAARRFEEEGKSVFVAIGPSDPVTFDHEEGYLQSVHLFTELANIFIPERKEDWKTIRTHVSGGGFCEIDPSLGGVGLERKYIFPLGPQFGEGHPHYAPHLSLVVTRSADIYEAYTSDPKKVLGMNERMKQMLSNMGLLRVEAEGGKIFFDDGFYGVTGTEMKPDPEIRTEQGLIRFIEMLRDLTAETIDSETPEGE